MLLEQAAMVLVREMPVLSVARFNGITDERLWRIVEHSVAKALRSLGLCSVAAFGFDAGAIAFRPPRGATISSLCSTGAQ